MIDFFAENPFVLILTMCLCNPPGLLSAGVLFYLARRYNIRSPLVDRGSNGQEI
jgi:hypothetical protein